MSFRLEIEKVYASERSDWTFAQDLAEHRTHGFVFDLPGFFVMGRPVNSKAQRDAIVCSAVQFEWAECDAWMIKAMAGDLTRVWSVLPFDLPLICFERMNNLRFYSTARMKRLSHEFQQVLPAR